MSFVINPASVSFDAIKADLQNFVASQPDAAKWKGFFDSQTGTTVLETLAGLGAFMKYDSIVSRREAFGQYAQARSSVVGYAQGLGYSSFRGRNQVFTITVVPNTSGLLAQYFVVGSAGDADLILLADTVINEGTPVDLQVVVGQIQTEDLQVQSINPGLFRFTNPLVSSDLRVKLNGSLVQSSERVLDMINEKFVTISNVNDSVDVLYLNLNTFALQYSVGDTIEIEYVQRKDWGVGIGDLQFGLGTLSNVVLDSAFVDVEDINSVRVNAPLFNETQFVIRGRSDYAKTFKLLDSSIVDTNYLDITPGVVELFAVRNDNSLFTSAQKAVFLADLLRFRPQGLQPPTIGDPTIVFLELDVLVELNGLPGNPNTAVQTVLGTYENKLDMTMNLADVENAINQNSFVKISRIGIHSSPWQANRNYTFGGHVHPLTPNGFVYQASKFLYFSGDNQPSWPLTPGDTIIDDGLIWQNMGAVSACNTAPAWVADHAYNAGDAVEASPNNGFVFAVIEQLNYSASSTEVQLITFAAVPTSGTWRIEYDDTGNGGSSGFTTDLAFNATALDVQNAIQAIPTLSGVTVAGDYTAGFTVTFGGSAANQPQPTLTLNSAGNNEVHCVFFSLTPNVGTFRLSFMSQQTSNLPFNATNLQVKNAMEALSSVGVGNIQVDSGIGGETYRIQFKGALGLRPLPQVTQVANDALFAATPVVPTVAQIQTGLSPTSGSNAVQKISFSAVPNSGNFSINFNGQQTPALDSATTAVSLQAALRALSTIGAGNVVVTGSFSAGFTLSFQGALALQTQPLVTIPSNTFAVLTVVSVTPTVTTPGGGGFNEVQTIAFSAVPTAGSFALTFNYGGIAAIYDVQAAQDLSGSLRSNYWFFDTPTTHYYVWYKVGGAGNDPGPIPGRIGIEVDININDVATSVQSASITAINAAASAVVTASNQPNAKIRLTMTNLGAVAAPTPQSTNFVVTTIQAGQDPFQETSPLPFNVSASTLQTALQGLPNIGAGNIIVTGNTSSGFIVEFRNALANTSIPVFGVDNDSLTISQSVTVTPTVINAGAAPTAGASSIQQVNFQFVPDSGQFQLQLGSNSTSNILFSDVAATIQGYINALPGISGVVVSGNFTAGFLITFGGGSGNQPQPAFTIQNNTLAASSVPVNINITDCVPGVKPAQNLLNGITADLVTVAVITDSVSPEPNWGAAVGIVNLCP